MADILMTWFIGVGDDANGGQKKLPLWENVVFYLEELKNKKGSVTLDLIREADVGLQSLQVLAEDGNYVLTLGEDNGMDYVVRSYKNEKLRGNVYEILGDNWGGELICTDFELVKKIFEDFFLMKKISNELLD